MNGDNQVGGFVGVVEGGILGLEDRMGLTLSLTCVKEMFENVL
jgi:hypothetical protein